MFFVWRCATARTPSLTGFWAWSRTATGGRAHRMTKMLPSVAFISILPQGTLGRPILHRDWACVQAGARRQERRAKAAWAWLHFHASFPSLFSTSFRSEEHTSELQS